MKRLKITMKYDDVTTLIFALQKAILYETHISPNHMVDIDGHEKEHLEGYKQMRTRLIQVICGYNNKYPKESAILEKGLYLEWEDTD